MNAPDDATLAALRDIHLPEAVPFWPPAPGWWALAALLLAGILLAVTLRRASQRRGESWQSASARELSDLEQEFWETHDETALAAGLSALLRRSVLVRSGRPHNAALHGERWFECVCEGTPGDPEDSLRAVRELTSAAYRGTANDGRRPEAWIAFVRNWIGEAS